MSVAWLLAGFVAGIIFGIAAIIVYIAGLHRTVLRIFYHQRNPP